MLSGCYLNSRLLSKMIFKQVGIASLLYGVCEKFLGILLTIFCPSIFCLTKNDKFCSSIRFISVRKKLFSENEFKPLFRFLLKRVFVLIRSMIPVFTFLFEIERGLKNIFFWLWLLSEKPKTHKKLCFRFLVVCFLGKVVSSAKTSEVLAQ